MMIHDDDYEATQALDQADVNAAIRPHLVSQAAMSVAIVDHRKRIAVLDKAVDRLGEANSIASRRIDSLETRRAELRSDLDALHKRLTNYAAVALFLVLAVAWLR